MKKRRAAPEELTHMKTCGELLVASTRPGSMAHVLYASFEFTAGHDRRASSGVYDSDAPDGHKGCLAVSNFQVQQHRLHPVLSDQLPRATTAITSLLFWFLY